MFTRSALILAAAFGVACSSHDAGTAPAALADASSSTANSSGGTASASAGMIGTVSLLAGTCPAISFKLEGKVFKTTASTKFDGIACADVKNGTRLTIAGSTQADGSVLAEKVGPAAATTTTVTPTPTAVTLTGTVSLMSGSCPVVTFKLEGKTFKTSAATVFSGATCADVKDGARFTVSGPVQTDGSVIAEKLAPAPSLTPAFTPVAMTITGTASATSGTCPAVSFKLEAKVIKTSASTRFEPGTCADVKDGARFTISGSTQADGSVLAEKVALLTGTTTTTTTTSTAASVSITGTISGIAGSCPTVSFVLEGKTIKISAATTYERGECAGLRNAIRVTATGTPQADGTVVATRVAFIL